jgi:hypothetical protein
MGSSCRNTNFTASLPPTFGTIDLVCSVAGRKLHTPDTAPMGWVTRLGYEAGVVTGESS